MKILYSVNGDGLGHVTRSIPIIQHLSKEHELIIVVSSKRAAKVMRKYYDKLLVYEGLRFIYENNEIVLRKTITENAKLILKNSNVKKLYNIISKSKPDVIITDGDHLLLYMSAFIKPPIICICNLHALSEMKLNVPKKYRKPYYTEKLFMRICSKKIRHNIITTFFKHPVDKKNVYVYPPVLRKEILDMNPSRKNYYMVYQTSSTNNKLLETIKKSKEKFIVYGFDTKKIDGNLTFRKTNNKQFFKDFKDCKAVITNGGHSFITEAISLHKPILSIPVKKQFEQVLNAIELERLGYGMKCDEINLDSLDKFINNIAKYYSNLRKVKKTNNDKLFAKIDDILEGYNARNSR